MYWACHAISACLAFLSYEGMAQEAMPKYTGKPLTLNFQTIEVRTALQIIADFTGLNVVASDSVTGSLSLRLHQDNEGVWTERKTSLQLVTDAT